MRAELGELTELRATGTFHKGFGSKTKGWVSVCAHVHVCVMHIHLESVDSIFSEKIWV